MLVGRSYDKGDWEEGHFYSERAESEKEGSCGGGALSGC